MKVGDLVTYGDWYHNNVNGKQRIGVIVDASTQDTWFVMWSKHEHEWECGEDLEVIYHENRRSSKNTKAC